jgi:hypothetical protein
MVVKTEPYRNAISTSAPTLRVSILKNCPKLETVLLKPVFQNY